ncbi:MAG: methylated-DNA--[protein]-cysteine S-methyltransferase [Planctomycetes bacterium]|nr:methylated-DNA--[protein]-cysteine S-methyltransferase [Planctomycetota bacterium]
MDTSFRTIATPAGYVGIVAGQRGLCRVYLPEKRLNDLRGAIRREYAGADEDQALMPQLADELRRYFAGEAIEFHARLDWSAGGPFASAVWRACRQVRYGRTVTYKSLAERVGRAGAARAVGTAMARNPWPIVVPCHRVLRSDGSLGGYSGAGGVGFKRRLLAMEARES